MNKGELTKRQQLILEFIRVFHAANLTKVGFGRSVFVGIGN